MKKFIHLIISFISLIYSLKSYSQWTEVATGINEDFNCVYSIPNNSTVYACGNNGKIVMSFNGGTNWQTVNSGTSSNLYSIAFQDGYTGWAAGTGGKIIKTINGGNNWSSQSGNGTKYNSIYTWVYSNPGSWAIIVGDVLNGFNPIIKRTTNGGTSWENISNNFTEDIMDVMFFDNPNINGYGYAVGGGTNCLILKADYGGLNWTKYPVVIPGKLNSVYFINQFSGFAVGNAGKYLKTTNAGANWSVSTLSLYDLKSIFFPDSLNGWIVGSSGRVFNTTNGGNNWIAKDGISGNHTSVHFSNVQTGWIATNLGIIYRTTNGGGTIGIQQISSEIPDEYNINQNYPNPFNPSTTIKFQIANGLPVRASGRDKVTLRVYDVTGREVQTLVNKSLEPGTYEVTFDGSGLNSGVYFYKLITGGFRKTKKMLLIK